MLCRNLWLGIIIMGQHRVIANVRLGQKWLTGATTVRITTLRRTSLLTQIASEAFSRVMLSVVQMADDGKTL